MNQISIIDGKMSTKFRQAANAIILEIEKGTLQKNEKLPSINDFSKKYSLSKDTVEKAYKELIRQGYVTAIKGRGNYILGKRDVRLKILLVLNKLSSYKKIIYDSLLQTLGANATVDLFVYHYDPQKLKEIIDNNLGNYHYYLITPHFFHNTKQEEYFPLLKKIPAPQLLLLDKEIPELDHKGMAVYQDFEEDIFEALNEIKDLLEKYDTIFVVFPKYSNHPAELNKGVLKFCMETNKQFSVVSGTAEAGLKRKTAYVVLTESDLAIIVKQCRHDGHIIGQDIGILSFNETVLKELLDITVVTTDFEFMGRCAAELILANKVEKVKNPFYVIRRGSL